VYIYIWNYHKYSGICKNEVKVNDKKGRKKKKEELMNVAPGKLNQYYD